MTSTQGSAFNEDSMDAEFASAARHGHGYDTVTGILFAVGGSLLLWAAIGQFARWAAYSVF